MAICHRVEFVKGQNVIKGGLEERGTSPFQIFVEIGPSNPEIF